MKTDTQSHGVPMCQKVYREAPSGMGALVLPVALHVLDAYKSQMAILDGGKKPRYDLLVSSKRKLMTFKEKRQ